MAPLDTDLQRSMAGPGRSPRGWSVEIYLTPGGVVRERTGGRDPGEAIEAALARSYIVPGDVEFISAHPIVGGCPCWPCSAMMPA